MVIPRTGTTPHRFDVVGSFLRPAELCAARADFTAGTISADELREVEDRCIRELVERELAEGLAVVTDGEFRRATWHLDFMWGLTGVGHCASENGIPFHGEDAKIDDTYLTGRLSVDHHPFVDHFIFLQEVTAGHAVPKITLPAPAQTLLQFLFPMNREGTDAIYPVVDELVEDVVTC